MTITVIIHQSSFLLGHLPFTLHTSLEITDDVTPAPDCLTGMNIPEFAITSRS